MEAHASEVPDAEWDAFVQKMEISGADGLEEDSYIDFYLEEIGKLNAETWRNDEVAERRANMIEDWHQGEFGKIQRRIKYLTGQIGILAPADAFKMKDLHGKKSRSLPNGTYGYRTGNDRIELDKHADALVYAKGEGLDINVLESVTKTTLMAHFKATGAIEGPGWHYVKGTDAFFVKAAE